MRRELATSSRADRGGGRCLGLGLEAHAVEVIDLQLGRILDRDQAFAARDEAREHVEQRRLAAAGAAANQDVEASHDADIEKIGHAPVERARRHEILDRHSLGRKLADGQAGAAESEGWAHDIAA